MTRSSFQANATLRSAHAATLTEQAQLAKAKADLSSANATEKNAEAIAAKDLATETNAKAQWERADELFREQVTDQQDTDTVKANYEASLAQVTAKSTRRNKTLNPRRVPFKWRRVN